MPVDLQPQYFYATTARCIYCYKHLCNERHHNKTKNGGTSGGSTKKKPVRRRPEYDDDDDAPKRSGSRASSRKRNKGDDDDEEEEWSNSPRRMAPAHSRPTPIASHNPPPNVLHMADQAQRTYLDGPRILQDWQVPSVTREAFVAAEGAKQLMLKMGGAPKPLEVGKHLVHGSQSLLLNATPLASCLGWLSNDMLVVGGGASLQLWTGLHNNSNPRLLYALVLEGGDLTSFVVLPRSGKPNISYAAVAAVHRDGRVRLHHLPMVDTTEPGPVTLRQTTASPVSEPSPTPVQSLAVSTHPSHPDRIILGHQDGSLRWVDLPACPQATLPAFQGNGGAGFSIASAGYLPTSDAAFWAVGDSASVAIGDIREPFGGPVAPPSSGAHTESYLKTADSSIVFPALVAGGDGGHVWALPWAGEHTPPPRLLSSLNGAALAIKCHPFLPLAITGCASGAARALWLPVNSGAHKSQQQLIIHAASQEEECVVVDSPADLNDQGFRNAGELACVAAAWAPDVDGRYAVAHQSGLIRIGVLKEFVLRSAGSSQ